MVNAIVKIDTRNLHQPLEPLTPRFASSYNVKFVNAPQDVGGVFVRVFKGDGQSYFDCPATQDGNGDWSAYLIGTCFPAVCRSFYEVHAVDEQGNPTSLGRGNLIVEPFSMGGEPIEAGTVITVATLPDKQGRIHRVVAVNIGTAEKPEWTWEVSDVVSGVSSGISSGAGALPDASGALHQVRITQLTDGGGLVPETKTIDGTGE